MLVVTIDSLAIFAYINYVACFVITSFSKNTFFDLLVLGVIYYDIKTISGLLPTKRGEVAMFRPLGIPQFLGLSMYSMEGIGLVFPIRASI